MSEGPSRNVMGQFRKCRPDCHYFAGALSVWLDGADPDFEQKNGLEPYSFITGVSGSAFAAVWQDMRFEQADITQYAGTWAEPVQRVFAALGRDCQILSADPKKSEAADLYADQTICSIDRGVPLLAHGVMGPPVFNLVTGYEDHGKILLGTGFFQNFFPMKRTRNTANIGASPATDGTSRNRSLSG